MLQLNHLEAVDIAIFLFMLLLFIFCMILLSWFDIKDVIDNDDE